MGFVLYLIFKFKKLWLEKGTLKREVKLLGNGKEKLSMDGRSYPAQSVRENGASVIWKFVLYGSIAPLFNCSDGNFFFFYNRGAYGRKLKHLTVQAYFLRPNLGSLRNPSWICANPAPSQPTWQSKQKVGRGGEPRDSGGFLICRVSKTTGP